MVLVRTNFTRLGRALISEAIGVFLSSFCALDTLFRRERDYKQKVVSFKWKNKKEKMKRTSRHQDYDCGGLCMTDRDFD